MEKSVCRPWTLVILVFLYLTGDSFALTRCDKVDPCTCETDEGNINLWSLADRKGTARFQNLQPAPGQIGAGKFSWNPCKPFTETVPSANSDCTDVAACQIQSTATTSLGTQDSAKCVLTSSMCSLIYSTDDKEFHVELQCRDEVEPKPSDVKIDTSTAEKTIYSMSLSTVCACPGKCTSSPVQNTELSNGTILCIIFAVLIVVYLTAGMTFNHLQKGAKGRELVPNWSFWSKMPYLIKDGFVFTFTSLRSSYRSRCRNYNEI